MEMFDFSGWATRNDLKCSDGRIIRRDAFKHNDGEKVPLVWNHQHNNPNDILGHALLENRDEGVYAYCKFNDTESGNTAKLLVQHGDVVSLSIYANQLQQQGPNVIHGAIREVSLVVAGANPGASIQNVMRHSADGDGYEEVEDEAIIYADCEVSLFHSDEAKKEDKPEEIETEADSELSHADSGKSDNEDKKMDEEDKKDDGEETVEQIYNSLTDKQKAAVEYIFGEALGNDSEKEDIKHSEGGNEIMKKNAFDSEEQVKQGGVLSHSDEIEIIKLAKQNGGCTLKHAMETYINNSDTLSHGFVDEAGEDAIDQLFPDYKDVRGGAPELVERDMTWVTGVMRGVHKSPISRIRTRFADARSSDLRAKGYPGKGNEKTISGNIKLVNRTTDPQTVYRKDSMHRDDIIDITDFDVVEYQYRVMRDNLEEELAMAIMIGDGRDEGDADKISAEHIRPIWLDDDLYTIHADVDIAKMKTELQGSNTSANFGENYIYAEAIIQSALYAREKYKGQGNLEFYCTPHLLNVMLLARDLNGRRIYESKADLAAALNVRNIYTAEQFENKTRVAKDGSTKKLLGLFVNLNDYHVGSTKGGEITRFQDFDIDFNSYKYLIETRLSGAMVNLWSAIALEEPVSAG